MDSILDSVKKTLGIDPSYDQFDVDIIMHINTTFVILNQLGVGPEKCFSIEDDTAVWADFFGEDDIDGMVKTYLYQKVKMLFDPPLSSSAANAMTEQISEFEWRMNVNHDTRRSEDG